MATKLQIAFYASTPAYRGILDLHGWDFGPELTAMSKRGDWMAMGEVMPDEVVDEVTVTAPLDTLGAAVRAKYDGHLDRVGFYFSDRFCRASAHRRDIRRGMGDARRRGARVTRVLVVRHGEAEGNREHRFIGQSDVPLTEHGRQQVAGAHSPARLDRDYQGGVIGSSTGGQHRRLPSLQLLGLDVEHDVRFREIANGEWANLVAAEVAERFPDLWSRYRGGEDVERPGGECWTDVQVRAVAALEELLADLGADETVLVGTHAGPALGMLRWAIGLPQHGSVWAGPFGQLHNTSISTISIPGPRLHTVNDTGHLGTAEGLFV